MRSIFAALIIASATPPALSADPSSVFYGRAIDHEVIEGVRVDCPEERICMDAWFRWRLRVDNLLSGPTLSRRITAATIQHAEYIPKYERSLRLFAVKPIESEEQRVLLGADYYLQQISPAHTMYCFKRQDPSDLSFAVPRTYKQMDSDHPDFCFDLPDGSVQ
ncbi:hypothetical protein ACOPJQ_09115 [Luteimonas dalianensis]|uniref:hypothetical protein n=1 Tax=Luteimonas dalianensis TaxID=1148196 RepID=UPI003BF3007C